MPFHTNEGSGTSQEGTNNGNVFAVAAPLLTLSRMLVVEVGRWPKGALRRSIHQW
jgi:hypothetical protein